jgi:6-phosphogluconolactonase
MKLDVVPDESALAHALAGRFVALAGTALGERGRFNVALAGGSTPKAAYALLAAAPLRDALDWSRVRFFFGDERCVPPQDDQSNYKMAKLSLLDALGIPSGSVFRMRGEDEPAAAARAYAEVLAAELAPDGDGTPALDLVMLGMGPDGHTASLFPGADPFTDDDRLVRAPYVAKFSAYRLTVTPRVLNAGRDVIVATAGEAKADALRAVLGATPDPSAYPIAVLRPKSGRLTWLVDEAAAAKLET